MKNVQSVVISTLVALATLIGTFTVIAKGYVSAEVFTLFKDSIEARLERIENKQDLILERMPLHKK